jgi:hypothetical protein
MSDEVSLSMSVPLDRDGFLRRECPTCEREFKVLVSQDEDDEATPPPEGGYFCPYCAVQAPPDAWWTKDQLEAAKAVMYREVVEPELKDFQKSIERMNRQSGGLIGISARLDITEPDEPAELSEVEDMRRVEFSCHPDDPLKVLEDWERPVHCMICGDAVPS